MTNSKSYKEMCIELYLDLIKEGMPEIEDLHLNISKSAFVAGFNMGMVNNLDESVQELALKMMIK